MDIEPRKTLRAQLRAARRAVDPGQRARAAGLVADHVDRAFHLRAGQRIALYSALPEELDTGPLMALAESRGCEIYLPRIDPRTFTMRFVHAAPARLPLTGQTRGVNRPATRVNSFGIAEPQGTRTIGARWLDLVFVPLVGFDAAGSRLGMGGGYYDRAFAFRHRRIVWRGPRLIGIAYALQQRAFIPAAAHDVKLDAVVTENGLIDCHTRNGFACLVF